MQALLFPLPHLMLNPGGKLTLNIFEERYLRLVEVALQDQIPMVVGHASAEPMGEDSLTIPHEKFPYLWNLAGYGDVQVLTETSADTKLIVVSGQGKGRVTKILQGPEPYIMVDIDEISEDSQLKHENIFLYRRLRDITREKVSSFLKSEREVEVLMNNINDPLELVAFYTDHLVKDWPIRQAVLKENDVNNKIQILGHQLVGQGASAYAS